MIISSFSAQDDLSAYPQAIQKALEFLKNTDILALEPGEYPIEGRDIYVKVFDITSAPVEQTHPEVHEKYCDVQYWVNGRERFGYAPDLGGNRVVAVKPEEDVRFYESVPNESFIQTQPGCFAIFFPYDAHRPGVCIDQPETFRKCVVKVSVDRI